MKNIKLVLEYDGTNYHGWQRQKNSITVQEVLEKALEKLLKEKIEVIGCSRTDSGVHARYYVANFFTSSSIPPEKFCYAINDVLPRDILALSSEEVNAEFHSRYSSKGKTYYYQILNREMPSALYRNYSYNIKRTLDINHMRAASDYFVGKHDFEAFRTLGSSVKTTVRTIKDISIKEEEDGFIKIYITADGFLYNMARIIVGTLIDVGLGKIKPEYIKVILESKDRKKAGKVVPAAGLFLDKVCY